jgi:hypothetical protein
VGRLNTQVGPFLLSEKTVAGRSYLDVLELHVPPQLRPQAIFQQGGVAPHFCCLVRNHLNRQMAGRWIGRGGPISWPTGSPDLTPLDVFLRGYMKNIIYYIKIDDLQHLKACIKGCCDYGNTKRASSNVESGRISSVYLSCQRSPH